MAATPAPPYVRPWHLHVLFACMALLAFLYRYERIYLDASYYLIHALESGSPRVDHQRFVLVLAELPAMITQRSGGSMPAVLTAYSLGHVLWAWLAAFFCLRVGRPELAVGVFLLEVVGRSFIFFTPMLEICYGCTAAIVLLAWWQRYPVPRGGRFVVWALLAVLTITSHPINWLSYGTVVVLVWLSADRSWRVLLLAIPPVLLLVWLKLNFLSEYENARLHSGLLVARLYDLPYLLRVGRLFLTHYPDALLLTLLGSIVLWRQRAHGTLLPLLALGATVIGFVNLNMEAYEAGWYHEVMYFPAVFAAVLIGVSALPKLSPTYARMTFYGLLLITTCRAVRIIDLGTWHQERTESILTLLQSCSESNSGKCVVGNEQGRPAQLPGRPSTWEWSLPMEGMLLANAFLDRPINLISASDLTYDPLYRTLPDTMILFRRQEPRGIHTLRPGWFQVQAGPYVYLED